MSEERLWKFRKPEWMNSAVARSAGVYAAGALVCFPSPILFPLAPDMGIFGGLSCVVKVGVGAERLLVLHQPSNSLYHFNFFKLLSYMICHE
jgi:hypothetical protein